MIHNDSRINSLISDKKKNRSEYIDEDSSGINDNPDRDQHGNRACNGSFLKKSLLIEP